MENGFNPFCHFLDVYEKAKKSHEDVVTKTKANAAKKMGLLAPEAFSAFLDMAKEANVLKLKESVNEGLGEMGAIYRLK